MLIRQTHGRIHSWWLHRAPTVKTLNAYATASSAFWNAGMTAPLHTAFMRMLSLARAAALSRIKSRPS